jgi:hypothetical protein
MKTRKMKSSGYVARMGEKISAIEVLLGKPAGRNPLGRY